VDATTVTRRLYRNARARIQAVSARTDVGGIGFRNAEGCRYGQAVTRMATSCRLRRPI
jgi:hypothetical protein